MAIGFDLAAAEVTLSLRNELPEIELVAVVPFEGMHKRFPAKQRSLFERVMSEANKAITLTTHYAPNVYALRNNYLVEPSPLTARSRERFPQRGNKLTTEKKCFLI